MKAASKAHLRVSAGSHPGMSGKNNEDRFGVKAYRTGENEATPSLVAIVADGIGGHRAGEVAAELAVATIQNVLAASSARNPIKTLEEAIRAANDAIYRQAESDIQQKGMGATCACCWIIGERLYTVTVGDSRIYLIRQNRIRQLSTDHTLIQEAIDQGALTREEARGHPNAHVIRRYLGSRAPVTPDFRLRLNSQEDDRQAEANQGLRLLPGDRILLCSDGLTDLVTDREIHDVLQHSGPERAVQDLIDLANQRGGHDNITIVALEAPASINRAPLSQAPKPTARRLQTACLGAGALLFIGLALFAGLYWFFGLPPLGSSADPSATYTAQPSLTQPISGGSTPTPSPTPDISATGSSPTLIPPAESPATLTPWPTNTRSP